MAGELVRRFWRRLCAAATTLWSRRRRDPGGLRAAGPARQEIDPFAAAPAELWAFFREAPTLVHDELGIHPLTEGESRVYSLALRRLVLGEGLGLVALDDADDSNPFCLVTKGLMRGFVVHLVHDAGARIRFASLDSFKSNLVEARERGLHIDDLPQPPLQPFADQAALAGRLAALVEDGSDLAVDLLSLFVPLLDPRDPLLLELLAAHKDLFVREALAELLANRPRRGLEAVAQRLAADSYRQIADPARRALERMRALPPTSS